MSQEQKSEFGAPEKDQKTLSMTYHSMAAQAFVAEEERASSSAPSGPVSVGARLGSPVPCSSQILLGCPSSSTPVAGVSDPSSDVGVEDGTNIIFKEAASVQTSVIDPLSLEINQLVKFFLEKYRKQEAITQADMLKVVNKKYKEHFPEIFRRTSERVELVFGLDLKEDECNSHSYVLVSKLSLSTEDRLNGMREFPKTGLVMTLLGVIFMKGNRVTEEEMWEFLNALGIYAGRRHLIFGEPWKLITKDLVHEQYLEYRQVLNTDPPTYEFLWGPRAHGETSKMKVLEFLAKINDTVPRCFRCLYDEALRDEQVRAVEEAACRTVVVASSRVSSQAKYSRSSHI